MVRVPQFITACNFTFSSFLSSLAAANVLSMYSSILADGRLRDLVNGHTLAPQPHQSDAAWSAPAAAIYDGSLGFGGASFRGSSGVLGAEDFRPVVGDTASTAAAAPSSEKESVDIRSILSNPLPPLPSDVAFVQAQASFNVTGALHARFQRYGSADAPNAAPSRTSSKSARKEGGRAEQLGKNSAKTVISNSFRYEVGRNYHQFAVFAMRPQLTHCCFRLGTDNRENQVRLEGFGRGLVLDSAANKLQHAQRQQQQQVQRQPHEQLSSTSSSKTQRVAIPLTSVPTLPLFQHHLEPTQLRANSPALLHVNPQTPSQPVQNVAVLLHSPANIHLPDPLHLTATYDDTTGGGSNISARNAYSASNAGSSVVRARIILPSPPSSAAPTPRDNNALPLGFHRNPNGQQPHHENDEELMFDSAAHMHSAHLEQQQIHRPQSPAAQNVFDRSAQPFPADLSPVPPAASPPSVFNRELPPRYSPLPVRSVLKLESAIQASSAAAASVSVPATQVPLRSVPQTSLAIITGQFRCWLFFLHLMLNS